jgi:hypothetical protein
MLRGVCDLVASSFFKLTKLKGPLPKEIIDQVAYEAGALQGQILDVMKTVGARVPRETEEDRQFGQIVEQSAGAMRRHMHPPAQKPQGDPQMERKMAALKEELAAVKKDLFMANASANAAEDQIEDLTARMREMKASNKSAEDFALLHHHSKNIVGELTKEVELLGHQLVAAEERNKGFVEVCEVYLLLVQN